MRTLLTLTISFLLACCNNSATTTTDKVKVDMAKSQQVSVDTIATTKTSLTKLSVLVLPPFDETANEGISPDIQKLLETTFSNDTAFALIKFPYRRLMNVPYQNVFDKKYCKPNIDKIKVDIILMTKLNQETWTGQMTSDQWNFQIKVYNTNTGSQFLSTVEGNKLTSAEIEELIKSNRQDLFAEIKNNR
jgi:hypothetical protein